MKVLLGTLLALAFVLPLAWRLDRALRFSRRRHLAALDRRTLGLRWTP